MGMLLSPAGFGFLLFVFAVALKRGGAQEDSLQSALNAVDRRQRDLSDFPRYGYGYGYGYDDYYYPESLSRYNGYAPEDRNELAFLGQKGGPDLNFQGDVDGGRTEGAQKRISSSFRERLEEERERKRERLAELLINKLEEDKETEDNERFEELLGDLWERRRSPYPGYYDAPKVYSNAENKKRAVYPDLGWDSVGMRKRSRYFDPDGPSPRDSLYLLNYTPRDELFDAMRQQEEEDDGIPDNRYNEKYAIPRQQVFSHPLRKRFPVTKRSSSSVHMHKRSSTKQPVGKTDPKVEKELSNIFGADKGKAADAGKQPKKAKATAKPKQTKTANATKEVAAGAAKNERPLQVKKKSIDWSDYFGLDRRKKYNDELDDDWLMERYHKAVAVEAKRSAEYPLQNFKNHDGKDAAVSAEKKEDGKIQEMDAKLRNIEDAIVDEALKYTGAHEGTTDSKEIQEVKDRVISRLAAAYSLEKMRQALGEYKKSVAKERDRLKESGKPDDYVAKEKRLSVPRKQAIDEDRDNAPEPDNKIKCAQGGEDCDQQNYRVPESVFEQAEWQKEDCPKLQQVCEEAARVLGHYDDGFESACRVHQHCLLCGENTWFAPTRQCNVLFLSKVYELCNGNVACQKEAQRSIRYLLEVNRFLPTLAAAAVLIVHFLISR